ncbi:hypothetical protein F511_34307 [Dorcoceras hygrometricum]|uniref:Uncharacterized protein n=1 Tax=Dorcoceras hygrometricum TaxID=472368 RepID=A0A2Z7DD84_9LAMI|nr:hypothetical protein F511_34307 [Dorcoceras hygrometricum]
MKRYQQLRRCASIGISCDDISLDVITISSWLSADGLALMTSSVTSSYSADGLRDQSQESAEHDTQQVCFWKFGPQCPTSPLLPPQKDPLEDLILQLVYRPNPTTSSSVGKSSRELQCYCTSSRLGTQTQEKKKQAKCRDSTSRELQYPVAGNPGANNPVAVMNQQRSS